MILGIMLLLYPLFKNWYSYMIQKSLLAKMENPSLENILVETGEKNSFRCKTILVENVLMNIKKHYFYLGSLRKVG